MKILVCAKRVVDYNVRIRVKADGSAVETDNVKMSMNPFDEIAVEEAVRLKESGAASEIIITSIGTTDVHDILRSGLAMGADRAIHINTDQQVEPLQAAKLFKAVVDKENPDLVIMGKQAIDDDANQTGQMTAALLGWPQATFASKLELADGTATVTREVDGGLMTVNVNMPAVVTTDLRLNEPRYATLPNIMKARSKPMDTLTPDDLGVSITSQQKTLKVEEPAKRKGGGKVASVEELVDKLRNEAKVL